MKAKPIVRSISEDDLSRLLHECLPQADARDYLRQLDRLIEEAEMGLLRQKDVKKAEKLLLTLVQRAAMFEESKAAVERLFRGH